MPIAKLTPPTSLEAKISILSIRGFRFLRDFRENRLARRLKTIIHCLPFPAKPVVLESNLNISHSDFESALRAYINLKVCSVAGVRINSFVLPIMGVYASVARGKGTFITTKRLIAGITIFVYKTLLWALAFRSILYELPRVIACYIKGSRVVENEVGCYLITPDYFDSETAGDLHNFYNYSIKHILRSGEIFVSSIEAPLDTPLFYQRPSVRQLIKTFLTLIRLYVLNPANLVALLAFTPELVKYMLAVAPRRGLMRYFYSCSYFGYRPLHTYIANCEAHCYYYAVSTPFKHRGSRYPVREPGMRRLAWTSVLTFSDRSRCHLIIAGALPPERVVKMDEPIWLRDYAAELPVGDPSRSIVVYDVEPGPYRRRVLTLSEDHYRTLNVGISFIADICKAAREYGIRVFVKRKKFAALNNITNNSAYTAFLHRMELEGFIECLPNVSPVTLGKAQFSSISMPFTSTAVIMRHYSERPSVYYDPTGELNRDEPSADGILLLKGPLELDNFFLALKQAA